MLNIYDFLSDMVNRILISQKLKLRYVFLSFSNIIIMILKIMKLEGYISGIFLMFYNKYKTIIVKLKYYNNNPVIRYFKKAFKCRFYIYRGYKSLPIFMNGLGISILSTSKGLMTGKSAFNKGIGGKVLCYVF